MKKNFNSEIKKLESTDNIENKLMAFALYSNFHDLVVQTLSKYDFNAAKFYSDYLTATFGACIDSINTEGKVIDCETFVGKVIKKIDSHGFSNIHAIRGILDYQRDNTMDVEASMSYVNAIDSLDIDFETKAELVTATRNHINKVIDNISGSYGEKESHNFCNGLVIELVEFVPTILDFIMDLESFKSDLQEKTAEIIDEKVSSKEFDLNNFKSAERQQFVASLDESERIIYMHGFKYFLAGYCPGDSNTPRLSDKKMASMLNMPVEELKTKGVSLSSKVRTRIMSIILPCTGIDDESLGDEGYTKKLRFSDNG